MLGKPPRVMPLPPRAAPSALVLRLSVVALISVPAAAELVSHDDAVFGPDSLTFDRQSALDWLDVSLSTERSYDDIVGADGTDELAPGGDFAGFRYAHNEEVEAFFAHAGIDVAAGRSPANFAPVQALQQLLGGVTFVFGEDESVWGMTDGTTAGPGFRDRWLLTAHLDTSEGTGQQNGALDAALASSRWGSWLVRESSVVVPNAYAALEAPTSNILPWGSNTGPGTGARYQQVYASEEFPGPVEILALAWRPDAGFGSAGTVGYNPVEIRLSTTARGPLDLDSTFASNVGDDETEVFSGPVSLTSSFTGPAAGPKDFDAVLVLDTPFVYDPARGNLLLEISRSTLNGGDILQFWDAGSSDAIGRAFHDTDASALVAEFVDPGFGTVTKFLVPEPAGALSGLAALSAVATVCWFGWRRVDPS